MARFATSLVLAIFAPALVPLAGATSHHDGPFIDNDTESEDPLLRTVFLHRHGDRSPVYIPPAVSQEKFDQLWGAGLGKGQLTGLGMQQLHALGAWARTRYATSTEAGAATLLPPRYEAAAGYRCRSTDVDRTLMSANALQAGLWPLGTGPAVNLSGTGPAALPSGAQPVPIHTVPVHEDSELLAWDMALACDAVLHDIETGPLPGLVAAKDKENAAFLARVALAAGMPPSKPLSTSNLAGLADFLFCCDAHAMGEVVPGISSADAAQLFALAEWFVAALLDSSPAFVTAATWPIAIYARELLLGDQARAFSHLSAHDTDIIPLAHALGIYDGKQPIYGASIALELRAPAGGNLTAVKSNPGAGATVTCLHDTVPVRMPWCSALACPIAEFEKYFAAFTINKVEALCPSLAPSPSPGSPSPSPTAAPATKPPPPPPGAAVIALGAVSVALFVALLGSLAMWRSELSRRRDAEFIGAGGGGSGGALLS
jgi:hypothetical protein